MNISHLPNYDSISCAVCLAACAATVGFHENIAGAGP